MVCAPITARIFHTTPWSQYLLSEVLPQDLSILRCDGVWPFLNVVDSHFPKVVDSRVDGDRPRLCSNNSQVQLVLESSLVDLGIAFCGMLAPEPIFLGSICERGQSSSDRTYDLCTAL